MSSPSLPLLLRTNLRRRPVRNGILLLCVAAVAGLQVAASLLDRASRAGVELGLKRLGADLVAVPRGREGELERAYLTGEAALFYMNREVLKKIEQFDFVAAASPQLFLRSLSGASCCSVWNIFLIGFEPATDFTVRPWLADSEDRRIGQDEVLVGAALGSPPGTPLNFFGHRFTVTGTLAPSGMGLDQSVFIPLETAYLMAEEAGMRAEQKLEISRDQISSVMIRLKPEKETGLHPAKAAYLLEMGIPEITILQPSDLTLKVQQNLRHTLTLLRSASYAIWPITALLIGLIFTMAAAERRREFGLLRALGASRWYLFRLLMVEALFLAGLGAVAGVMVSLGLVAGFARLIAFSLQIPFFWPRPGEVAELAIAAGLLAVGTGLAAGWYPAWQASRLEPYEAVRTGG